MNLTAKKTKNINLNTKINSKIEIGKDLLEVLSSAAYLDPLAIFREYIQNATDSIDSAVSNGVLNSYQSGIIEINLDCNSREISICDNGIGLDKSEFINRLSSFGNSKKRDTNARGFRGIGRLAGLGYCQELVFRTRFSKKQPILELTWDCIRLRELLTDRTYHGQLNDIVKEVVTFNELDLPTSGSNFFEVKILRPRRMGKDILLNEQIILNYLSQVAPVPFLENFSFKNEIENLFKNNNLILPEYNIYINGVKVFRPYRDIINFSSVVNEPIEKLELIKICNIENSEKKKANYSAVGWVAHHEYRGAIPKSLCIRGLRARIGNMQVGDENLFVNSFSEERFNSWSIGEFHILDKRIKPNSRRDAFELSPHFNFLESRLIPICTTISKNCRVKSQTRNQIKKFEIKSKSIKTTIEILKKNVLSAHFQQRITNEIQKDIDLFKKDVSESRISVNEKKVLKMDLRGFNNEINHITVEKNSCFTNLTVLEESKIRELIDTVYDNLPNKTNTLKIIEEVIRKLNSKN